MCQWVMGSRLDSSENRQSANWDIRLSRADQTAARPEAAETLLSEEWSRSPM
jgi:hypothetical protein